MQQSVRGSSRVNIPLDRAQANKAHAVSQDSLHSSVQGQTGLHQLGLATDDLELVVRAAEGVRQLEQVSEHGGGLEGLERVLDDVGPAGHVAAEVDGAGLGKEGQVGGGELLVRNTSLAPDGVETGVGVLQVRAGVTLERGHGLHVEGVVVDSVMVMTLAQYSGSS